MPPHGAPQRRPRWLSFDYIIYDVATWILITIIGLFFREIKTRNSHIIPPEGPLFFVAAPHHNQVLCAAILSMDRKDRCLCASESEWPTPICADASVCA